MFDRSSVTANDLRAELEDPFAAPRACLHLHCGGGVVWGRELSAALRRSPGLADLWVQGRVFGGDSLGRALADALRHTPDLKSLRLTSVGELAGVGELAAQLAGMSLDSLEIHGTAIGPTDLEALAGLLRGGGPSSLLLSFVPLRGAAAVALASAAVSQPRDLLQFVRCDLAPDAVGALATSPAAIRRLVLELNPLRRNDVRLLLAAHPGTDVDIAYAELDRSEVERIRRDVRRARETRAAL